MGRDLAEPGPGQVLIRIEKTAVSAGTEQAFFNRMSNTGASFPSFPGYSGAGTVVRVGRRVRGIAPGARVAAAAAHSSGAVVDAERVYSMPAGVSFEEGAFIQLGIIARQAMRKSRLEPGEDAVVLGQGFLGQLLVQMCRVSGAGTVSAVAQSSGRFTETLRKAADSVVVLDETGDDSLRELSAPLVVDATGNPEGINRAVDCVAPGGRIILIGSTRGVTRNCDFEALSRKGVRLIGAHMSSVPLEGTGGSAREEAEIFLRLLGEGRLDVSGLVTHRINPEEAEGFYRSLSEGRIRPVGAVFEWDGLSDAERLSKVRYWTSPDLRPVAQGTISRLSISERDSGVEPLLRI